MKSSDIDWSKAPEGTTHVFYDRDSSFKGGIPTSSDFWEKWGEDAMFEWNGNEWVREITGTASRLSRYENTTQETIGGIMIKEGIIKHKEVFDAWLQGAEIESFDMGAWGLEPYPEFYPDRDYRVVVEAPKEVYIVLDKSGEVLYTNSLKGETEAYLREYFPHGDIPTIHKYVLT